MYFKNFFINFCNNNKINKFEISHNYFHWIFFQDKLDYFTNYI